MENEEMSIITKKLDSCLMRFDETSEFSNKPGIYAIGFIGDEFPLESAKNSVKSGEIIYIGKTESSQLARDVNTHFKSGKSGSSTLRRTIGAILLNQLSLNPIPRSYTEKSNRRFRNYKFDKESEEKITNWMKANLTLAYWKYDGDIAKLEDIETKIIKELKPILNLSKNSSNPWYQEIRFLRDNCVDLAKKSVKAD